MNSDDLNFPIVKNFFGWGEKYIYGQNWIFAQIQSRHQMHYSHEGEVDSTTSIPLHTVFIKTDSEVE